MTGTPLEPLRQVDSHGEKTRHTPDQTFSAPKHLTHVST